MLRAVLGQGYQSTHVPRKKISKYLDGSLNNSKNGFYLEL